MGRIGLTYEEVELVAEKLLKQGISPTIERVRHELGTGSNSTISRYLSEWKSQRLMATTEVLPTLKTPSDPVNEAVKRVWQQMNDENEDKIKAIKAATDEQVQLAQTERGSAIAERDRLSEDTQALRDLLKEGRQKNAELEKRQLDLQQQVEIITAKYDVQTKNNRDNQLLTDTLLSELKQQLDSIKEIRTRELQTLKQQYEKENTKIKDMAEEQRHRLIVEYDNLKIENQKLQAQLAGKDVVLEGVQDKITTLQTSIEQHHQELHHLMVNTENISCLVIQQKEAILDKVESSVTENVQKLNKTLQTHTIEAKNSGTALQKMLEEVRLQMKKTTMRKREKVE